MIPTIMCLSRGNGSARAEPSHHITSHRRVLIRLKTSPRHSVPVLQRNIYIKKMSSSQSRLSQVASHLTGDGSAPALPSVPTVAGDSIGP